MYIYDPTFHPQETNSSDPNVIHTTLFDLIGAIDANLPSNAQDIVTDMVINALKSRRISCLGNFKGYEMVLGNKKTFYSAVA